VRAVNLLPRDAARGAGLRPSPVIIAAVAAPILAGGLVLAGYEFEHSSVTSVRGQLAAVQAQAAVLPQSQPQSASRAGLSAASVVFAKAERQVALDAALADRIAWDQTLQDVARVLPTHVWLTGFNLTSPTPADAAVAPPTTVASSSGGTTTSSTTTTPAAPAPVANPTAFSITGYTYSEAIVANLMTRLQLLPLLSNVMLGSTTSSTVGAKSVVQFTVDAEISAPSAPSAT